MSDEEEPRLGKGAVIGICVGFLLAVFGFVWWYTHG
jgi:hypothetical protein